MAIEKLSVRLKSMTFKEKIEYLWDYYKFHFIGAIAAIIFIVYIINAIVSDKDSILNVVFVGDTINSEEMQQLDSNLDQQLVPEENRSEEEVLLQFINLSSESQTQQEMVGVQKFVAQLSANAIDVIIANQENFEMLRDQGALLSLGEVINLDEINTDKHELLYSETEQPVGISTAEMAPLQGVLPPGNHYLFVPANMGNAEYIDDFIQYLTTG